MSRPQAQPAMDDEKLVSVDALEARLADGYARIATAEAAGLDVSAWENFWLALLDQYEAACDALHRVEAA